MNKKKTLLICFIILMVGGAFTTLIFTTEPTAQRTGATAETAMLVNVTEVQRETFRPTIRVMGTVEPLQDITLSPRVGGEIIERSESFAPGGYVQKGETLLQIDPSDYENTLEQRKSELTQVLSELEMEMGRQEAAQKEYQLYGDTLSQQSESLVLRQPQLEAVKSEVKSARAAVQQAELELQRTTIKPPFDAHILSRNVNVGSLVGPGDSLGRLVGLETYQVEANLPQSQIRWLTFPDGNQQQGLEVQIRNRTAWPDDEYRIGYLDKLVGALENQTRMAKVLISVPDPQSRNAENKGEPSLMIGSFVEASIKARELPGVVRVNRDYIRKGDTVWVMEDGKLHIQDVDIVFRDSQYAYIEDGLSDQDQVVTTNLSTVVDGAPLRLEGPSGQAQQESPSNTSE